MSFPKNSYLYSKYSFLITYGNHEYGRYRLREGDLARGGQDARQYRRVGIQVRRAGSDLPEIHFRQVRDQIPPARRRGRGLRGGQGRIHRREHLLRPRRGALGDHRRAGPHPRNRHRHR